MSTIPAGAIEILYDEQNQPWFKQVCWRVYFHS